MKVYREKNLKKIKLNGEEVEIPVDWKVVKLKDISTELYYGITAKSVEENTGLKMLRTTDIVNYSVDWDNLPNAAITEKTNNIEKYFLKKDDIIVSRAGTTGMTVLVPKDMDDVIFGSYLIKVKLKNDIVHPEYIHKFMQSKNYWNYIESSETGALMKNINLGVLKNLQVPLPPLEEQKIIADQLEKIDQQIERTRAEIENLKKLKRKVMNIVLLRGLKKRSLKKVKLNGEEVEILTNWKVVKLKDVIEFINGYSFSKNDWSSHGTPIIRIQNLNDPDAKFNYYNGDIDKKYIVNKGDILLSWSASIGVFEWNGPKAVLNQHIFKIKIIEQNNLHKKYLFYALDREIEKFKEKMHGSTMKHITKNTIENLQIPLPPFEEQKEIAEKLSKIDRTISLLERRIELLEKMKKGLMNELLYGHIRLKG